MKIKTLLITTALVVAAGAGTSYFVRNSYKNNVKTVEVTPVVDLNSASYGMSDSATVSGTIISKDTQVVSLDSSHELTKVYVQEGDKVKKGDKLLEYDMLGDELKAEKEELTKMSLELSLESMKKDLATLKSGRMPEDDAVGDTAEVSDSDPDDQAIEADEEDDYVDAEDTGSVGAADTMAEDSVRTGATSKKPGYRSSSQIRTIFNTMVRANNDSGEDEVVSDAESETETELIVTDDIPDAIPADEDTAALFSVASADEETLLADAIPAEGEDANVIEDGDTGDTSVLQQDAISTVSEANEPALIDDTVTASDEGADALSEIVVDSGNEEETLETNFNGDIEVDDSTEDVSVTIIPEVNSFLLSVNDITNAVNGGWDAVRGQITAIEAAMQQFQNSFATGYEFQEVDLFGDTVTLTSYLVSDDVTADVGSATASVMQTAYDRLCAYHFIYTMLNLNPTYSASTSFDPNWAVANEASIRAAAKELAGLPDSLWIYNPTTGQNEFADMYSAMNNKIFGGQSMVEFLAGLVQLVNGSQVLEDSDDSPIVSTDGKTLEEMKGTGDTTDTDTGVGYTAEELAEAIKEQEKSIKETELQIREAELGIKEYEKILDGRIVYAMMDGIVKSAGTTEESSGDAFMTITGKAGLYVQGTVNELALDTVKVGNTITGTSYSTGGSFTAQIVEISEYPTGGGDAIMYGEGNTNSSYYPFLAYIENADGLEVDSYVDLSLSGAGTDIEASDGSGSGLALEEYYIRKDSNGRNYCFVRGKDGLLEKRYLEVGANNWGIINIKSGLSPDDLIAFPYGDGVEEGAKTVEVDYLTAVDGEDY